MPLDPLHRTASEIRLGGELSPALWGDEEPLCEGLWPPRAAVFRVLSDENIRQQFPKLDSCCQILSSQLKQKQVVAPSLTWDETAQPEVDLPDFVAQNTTDMMHKPKQEDDDKSSWVSSPNLLTIIGGLFQSAAKEEDCCIHGSITLSGNLTESAVTVMNALRVGLQEVLRPAIVSDFTVAVRCDLWTVRNGLVIIGTEAHLPFTFEVSLKVQRCISGGPDRPAALSALESEAASAGAQCLLPTLVDLLPLAGRLRIRLETDPSNSQRSRCHSLLAEAPLRRL